MRSSIASYPAHVVNAPRGFVLEDEPDKHDRQGLNVPFRLTCTPQLGMVGSIAPSLHHPQSVVYPTERSRGTVNHEESGNHLGD